MSLNPGKRSKLKDKLDQQERDLRTELGAIVGAVKRAVKRKTKS
jgi:hypothetical protein